MPDLASHETTLIINARPRTWTDKKISYEQLVALAFPNDMADPNITYTVRYSRGHDGHGTGTLTSTKSVAVKKGMVFDVVRTVRS